MAKRKLPLADSPEGQEIIEKYPKADRAWLEEQADRWKYSSVETFLESVRRRYGLLREELSHPRVVRKEQEEKPETYVFPKVNLRKPKRQRVRKGDEEEVGLLISDGHAGKVTKSFNKDVYRERIETLFHAAMTIVNLHREMYPINKLRVVALGDHTQGENPNQGSIVGEIECGARDQTTKIAVPVWNDLLGSFKQEFTEVTVDGFGGNHGHSKLAPETSREDFRLYDMLQAGIGKEKGININICEDFGDIITILGWKFFCFHSDGIPCQQGIPYFAIDKKIKSYHMQYGGFDYVLSAHFHKRANNEIARGVEHFMNSTIVSDDNWALKVLGISSEPSQWIFGVHPRKGVTWRYPLIVEKSKFEKVMNSA